MIKKKVSIIVFFLSIILFCLNLRVNFSEESKIIIFWASTVMMLGIILYQIFYVKNNQFVLFEIILFYFLLHLLYQINYFGLAENDSYRDFDFLKTIINSNHFVINPDSDVSGWPMLHLFTSFITLIIKIDPLIIAKILPSFIDSIIAISIYLFVSTIYKNKKAALISCLIVGTIPKFISFESFFVRESYALYFFILFFLVLYIAKQRNDYRLLALSFFLIPVIVLSHHFTTLMLIIMLLIFIVFSKIISFIFKKNPNLILNIINIKTIFIILLLAIVFYWLYFIPGIINDFFKIYLESTGLKEFINYGQRIGIDTTIVTLRGNVLFYGFFFFQGILSLTLLIALFLKKQKQIIENTSFTFFLYFCLGLGAISLLLLGSLIYPDRFLPFGWLFGAIPLSILIFSLKSNMIRKMIVLIVISFLIFNIYNIDPSYYTGKGPFDGRASEKEYAIAHTINISKPYYGYAGVGDAIYDIQRFDFARGGMKNLLVTKNFFDCDLAIIYKDIYLNFLEFEKIKSLQSYEKIVTRLSYEDFNDISKISDLGDIFIITWKNYTITASAGIDGFIDPTSKVKVLPGLDQTFTIHANTGFRIVDVLVDGTSVGAVSTYTFNDVAENHKIVAFFAITE
jgi:hypothetical protein